MIDFAVAWKERHLNDALLDEALDGIEPITGTRDRTGDLQRVRLTS